MKILLANPRGFCAGVNMAIESLDRALQLFGTPLYVFHEIVHNRYVVEGLEAKGAVFVEEIDGVPDGAPVVFSRGWLAAQGVPNRGRANARCVSPRARMWLPLVARVTGSIAGAACGLSAAASAPHWVKLRALQ